MFRSKVQLLAAGASILAINAVVGAPASAQVDQHQDTGVYQNGTTNVYTVPDSAFPAHPPYHGPDTHGEFYLHTNTGGLANADASVTTDTGGANPGMIHQDAGFAATPSNTINVNSGTLTVRADANAVGGIADADAQISDDANGIGQHIFSYTTGFNELNVAAGAGVTIRAEANANASTGAASANASITEAAIEQWTLFGGNGRNEIANDGVITLLVDADATAADGAAVATANLEGYGIGQRAGASEAANAVDNTAGTIDVTSRARGFAPTGDADARAFMGIGVGQLATGGDRASGVINNVGGTINVDVAALATGDTAYAHATLGVGTHAATTFTPALNLEGIGQRAYAPDADGVASVTLDNSGPSGGAGTIDIDVAATANADVGGAFALATLETGIYHDVTGGQQADAAIVNGDGALGVNARAKASAHNTAGNAGGAEALAFMGSGIEQNVNANGTDDDSGKASASLTNGVGTVDVTVDATATGDAGAFALGLMFNGITQSAIGQTEAVARIDNVGGTMNVGVGAVANGVATVGGAGGAGAIALMQTGIYQRASAVTTTDVSAKIVGDADAVLANTGTINITVDAAANVTAGAALATGGDAFALAAIGTAIEQNAYAGTEATALLDNSGTLNIAANAHAVAANGDATARAGLGGNFIPGNNPVIRQWADDAVASVVVGDAGVLNIHANATATAQVAHAVAGPPADTIYTGDAYASASIGWAISQSAFGSEAAAKVTNNGLVDIRANANAKGGTDADAFAVIQTGVAQFAFAAAEDADADLDIVNSGTFSVVADANASALSASGNARAYLDEGFTQQAYAFGGDTANARAGISNAAGGVIAVSALADATGLSANATGSMETGIDQEAAAYGQDAIATVDLTNSGTLNIMADAAASAVEATAYARGHIGVGVFQYASAIGTYASADVSLTNAAAGVMEISAGGSAAGTAAYATGDINVGISQYALAYGFYADASIDLTNDGSLTIAAAATANADGLDATPGTHNAYATASVQTGIDQFAYAAALFSDDGNASVALTNNGTLSITADALANAADGDAVAVAYIGTGILQVAGARYNFGEADATLTNNETMSITAEADAIVSGIEASESSAYAYAYVYAGIVQVAVGEDFHGAADVALTNNGSLTISADAFASAATLASATATAAVAYGIYQGAFADGPFGDATVDLTNAADAALAVSAVARASGEDADAVAYVGQGIEQIASTFYADHGDAAVSLTNNGSLSVSATADAVATESAAFARASVSDFGILQYAYAVGEDGEAAASLTNSGSLRVAVDAAATADQSAATAYAFISDGIGQFAYAGDRAGGDADIALDNSGSIDLSGAAVANGSEVIAIARVNDGIEQYAYANGTDGDVNVDLTNSGTIDGALNATANATEGSAYAMAAMGRLVAQSAHADGTDGIADVSLTNGPGTDAAAQPGTITVELTASANATFQRPPTGASAYAMAFLSQVIDQYAAAGEDGDGGRATVFVDNSGLIDVTAVASAQADFSAYAQALVYEVIDQEAYAIGTDGDALARATNAEGGTISASLTAKATGGAFASAHASLYEGVSQYVVGSAADAEFTNHGTLSFTADADALAGVYAYADASASGISQGAFGGTHASVLVVNDGALTVTANANAQAGNITPFGGDAAASAFAEGINQFADVVDLLSYSYGIVTTADGDVFRTGTFSYGGSGPASATVNNTAAIDVTAVASATGSDGYGVAYATAYGIDQYAVGNPATVLVTNDAALTVLATGKADGGAAATAYADAFGINQDAVSFAYAYSYAVPAQIIGEDEVLVAAIPVPDALSVLLSLTPEGPASATVLNTSAIDVTANANAVADAGPANAFVGLFHYIGEDGATVTSATGVQGIWQDVFGTEATALVNNSADASITVDVSADAHGVDAASAIAIGAGVLQFASAVAYADAEVLTLRGAYTATLTTTPTGTVDVTLVNDGTIALTAAANAVADTGAAFASVNGQTEGFFNTVTQLPAAGVVQFGHGQDVTLTVENNGSLTVDANAAADGGTSAVASARVAGVLQLAGAFGWTTEITQEPPAIEPTIGEPTYTPDGTVSLSLTNTDTIDVSVTADADAATFASASAYAVGVGQLALGEEWDATLINNGDLLVSAVANATATGTAVAHATAIGYGLVASGGVLTVVNTDTIDVTADAGATGTASANAVGIGAVGTVLGTGVGATPGLIHGTITNSGIIDVRALVSQGTDATATGITVSAASATPVTPTPAATDPRNLIISNNGGTITAAVSYNGGAAPAAVRWHHGMAIDVSDANVGGTRINLTGAGTAFGTIYGNIDLSDVVDDPLVAGVEGDEIVVSGGETRFDGIINPEWAEPPLGPQPGEAPSTSQGNDVAGPQFGGTLSIVPGGTLFLRDNSAPSNTMYDGPAQAYVSTFSTSGNLAYELQIAGPNANAHYPQIFANTANLGGTLEIRRTPLTGPVLYGNVLYDNIIEADVRNGQFTGLIFTPPGPLVSAQIVYDGNQNVDLAITRTAFDVGCRNFGGTFNECSAAGGVESVYSTSLTGPFAGVVANLFTLNQAGYLDALNQLAGAQYASYLQGLRNNSFATNSIVSDQIDCAISIRAVDQCRDRNGTGRFWVMGKYNWANYDGDQEAGDYDLKGWTGMVGADYTFGNFTLGAFVGYRDIDLNFDWYNGDMSATGWQGGIYAGYDVGSFYVRGIGSYSSLDGDSKRDLNFATTIGTLNGDPDVNIMSFYGEAGARFDMGSSWLTPFAAVDYTDIKLKSFTETGPAAVVGAALAFDSQHEKQTSSLLGVKWAGNWGGIVPEAKLAWRHDFGDRTFDFDARFAGAPAGSGHRQISSDINRESIVGGLSLAAAFGSKTTGRIGYQGRFNSDVTDHSVYGSLTFHFGGAPAPAPEPIPTPPAPPPAAEPAPPPAVVSPGPFIVFFDWDKSDVTPQAAAILDNAAAAYQQTGSAQVMLAGNADRSGPSDYNVGLSQRRADAVRAYLSGRGVPDNVITTEANGENRPIVETADGVREPQNRNVQITYGPGSGQ